jgi:glycosyltransferase involved in cell wall biosynthesis
VRVALLSSVPDRRGSAESFAKIAAGLMERGHAVQLLTAADLLLLRATIRRHHIEALLADTPRDLRLAAGVTLLHRVQVVYRYNVHRNKTPFADRLCLPRVAACVYQSRWLHVTAERHTPLLRRIPSCRIPNGYDPARYAPDPAGGRRFRATWDIAPESDVVMTHARLVSGKGHEVAMAALARMRERGSAPTYLVCGEGPRAAELRRLAASLGVATVFTGLLEPDGIVAALSAADVVVHPSLQEIFPNAVGEAMACGRPVIASDAGGTAELLGRDDVTGRLVPPGDPEALASALLTLLADPSGRARLGAAARRRIETEFSLRRMIDGYEQVLKQVLR